MRPRRIYALRPASFKTNGKLPIGSKVGRGSWSVSKRLTQPPLVDSANMNAKGEREFGLLVRKGRQRWFHEGKGNAMKKLDSELNGSLRLA